MRKFVHNLNPILKLLLFSYVTHRYQNGGNKEINNLLVFQWKYG